MFEQVLIQNGLSTKEAALYLAVLEAGELTHARAAEKSHLKRSTVYNLVEEAHSILPALMELAYASPVKPRIRFYEGQSGIKEILLEASSSGKDYIGFIDYTLMPREIYRHIRTKIAPTRQKLGNRLRLLMPRNPTNERIQKEYRQMIEHRLVDFPSRKNHIEILLYEGSKIGCMSYVRHEMFGVVIDSEGIYQTLHDLFMLIWEKAK